MTKILKQTVYQNAMPSADTSGVMFIVDGHMHIFQMTPLEICRADARGLMVSELLYNFRHFREV